ncbi:MAG: Ig-like domain-containing protein [Deltaproteobacteria bacterium]|nr:Ig-like domain-containing protein [Deltaproteobacteria bacterium]
MCKSGGSPTSTGSNTQRAGSRRQSCASCTVTLSPKPLNICGAGTTKDVTATGSPGGGSFNWQSSDTGVATVSGTESTVSVEGVAAGKSILTVTYNVEGCTPCTDDTDIKVCTCTAGRKYAYGKESVADVIGIKGKIKTRYGKVCCEDEGCSTTDAYHVVYANITNDAGASMIWAQTGYGRERNGGSTAIKTYRYAEMNGSGYKVNYDNSNAPAEGATHTYQCDLDKSTGKWTFSYDGTEWQTFSDNGWKNKTGTVAQWVGEIYNKEDDMPGTTDSKCSFTDCQYQCDGGAYQDTGFTVGDMITSDASEWGVERVSDTEFNIWDKNPLP